MVIDDPNKDCLIIDNRNVAPCIKHIALISSLGTFISFFSLKNIYQILRYSILGSAANIYR